MKKSLIAAALAASLLLSGCSGVSQEEYNSLVEENSRLQAENSSLQSQYDKLNIEYAATNDLLESYGEEIYNLKLQLKSQTQSETSDDSTDLTAPEEVKVYEDDFIKINYVGFGKGAKYPFQNRDCLILTIENKTDTTFEFLPNSLALDGNDEGSLACYEKISPKSNGKIYILKMSDTDQYFNNRTPSKISCELSVKDYSNIGVFGENNWWHKISFVNIDLKLETSLANDTSNTETIPNSTMYDANEQNYKKDFLIKIDEMEKMLDISFKIDMATVDDDLHYEALYQGKFFEEEILNAYVMFYSDDVQSNCDLILKSMETIYQYLEWSNGECKKYDLYINDPTNNHIVTISNSDGIPKIYWYDSAAQDQYGEIEDFDYFKDFQVKVINP